VRELGRQRWAAVGERDGDAQLREAAVVALALTGQHRDPFRDRGRSQVEAVPAVCERRDPAERRVAVATDNDRDPPAAHRLRVHAHRFESGEFAMERGDVVSPERPHRGNVLHRAPPAVRERDAERGELFGRPADAHAESQPAAGQHV
jgi:hypothetical protein